MVTAEFDIGVDQIEFRTKTNGDVIRITNVHLGKEAASALAELINDHDNLKIEIKKAE